MAVDISVRYIAYADVKLVYNCCNIAGEFLGNADFIAQSIQCDVNVLNNPMFIAETPDGNVGGFVIARWPGGKLRPAEISSLYVRSDMHRNGIGALLLLRMENYLRENGAHLVWLNSRPWATPFYRAHGYVCGNLQKNHLQKVL